MIKEKLTALFEKTFKESVSSIEMLPRSGSDRIYYRMRSRNNLAIGAFNPDVRENNAFIKLTEHFLNYKLNVPQIYEAEEDYYLLEDLGDTTLYSLIEKYSPGEFTDSLKNYYHTVIADLPKFQIETSADLDFDLCYPRSAFDEQSISWDLNYFKYYFLKLTGIKFDEQHLENDFNNLKHFLISARSDFFIYRDFQSRNIMIKDDHLYYIDYQGGRKGPLQYDIASLLFDAKANIPQSFREELLELYVQNINKLISYPDYDFKKYFYAFVLIRIMQAMGAYGFRGFYEKKSHFLKSIPHAIENLKLVLSKIDQPENIPHLRECLESIINSKKLAQYNFSDSTGLKVKITSFSYKKGLPEDYSGNGGGFVFDCRAIHNPGRFDEYKKLTGRDEKVIEFLKKHSEAEYFLSNVFSLIDNSVDNYLKRGFNNLQVNFGCTGGQHRSVYCAESLTNHLKEKYPDVRIELIHRELEEMGMD
ncbi:MAG: phosphotransferase [Melioribacteraceae bacterium]|nr:phosphotransferase [Melioribacteraceae bacterium]MCF8353240.1 phosphotransferase [Melioribacteraceae bacterium]MCF8393972.1 phosphotransferase [Melioribacteraceae bacterium]MCF8418726.1 phosphotransferase [Melioribacteraceae bacterium]